MTRWWSSLAVRLAVASLVWTLGLLYVAHLASVLLMFGRLDALGDSGHGIGLMLLVALGLMVLGAWIVRGAIVRFTSLRQQLLDVQQGRARLLTGDQLKEVRPVVGALNDLLAHQEQRVRDAMARAGDLAHGLKTPLAVLGYEAERAQALGQSELAASLRQQIERMRRHVDYHLAHARAAASGGVLGVHCQVAESAVAIARTLERLHAVRGITIRVDIDPVHAVRARREDLDEMLGNLLDNAFKWARTRVAVSSGPVNGRIVIAVEDDGPGLAQGLRDAVLQRGVRADEATPGSGLGLAIVRDVAELYGGAITLYPAALGGLGARLELPAVESSRSGPVQGQ